MSESASDKQAQRPAAVALKYESERDAAPRITASGRGSIAEQIVATARANGVAIKEDADLVEVLAALELDSLIPIEVYAAVAEILSYVYRANARAGAGR